MALKHVCVALLSICDWIIPNSGYRCFTSEYRIHWTTQLKQCNYFWWRLISGRNELAQSFQSKMLFHPIANPLWRRFPSWKSIKSSAKHYKYVVHWKSISRLRHDSMIQPDFWLSEVSVGRLMSFSLCFRGQRCCRSLRNILVVKKRQSVFFEKNCSTKLKNGR